MTNEPLPGNTYGPISKTGENFRLMVKALELALEQKPKDFWSWNNLAHLYFNEGQVNRSLGLYQKSLEIMPDHPVTHLQVGIAYFRLAKLAEAIDALKRAVKLDEDLVMAYYYLGVTYYHLGQNEESLKNYQLVEQKGPESAIVYYHLAEVYLQMKRHQDVIRVTEKLLRANPACPTAWYQMGLARFALHESAEAAVAFRNVLRYSPQDKRAEKMLDMILNVADI